MCGRFTLTKSERAQLEDEMGISRGSLTPGYTPRFNIAPTDDHFIVRQRLEDREIVPAKWGLINHWAPALPKPVGQINARAEGIEKRPAFREAFLRRRCIVPADGFFEWTGPKERRQPLWFHRPDHRLIWFAGLYESWYPEPGQRVRTFTIVTTTPNELVRPIHNRMPVILDDEQTNTWLNPAENNIQKLKALLVPAPEDLLIARPVSPLLNSPKNDFAELLEPYDDAVHKRLESVRE
ncbi:MAG: SOS response-associated peptidase [bacterium]